MGTGGRRHIRLTRPLGDSILGFMESDEVRSVTTARRSIFDVLKRRMDPVAKSKHSGENNAAKYIFRYWLRRTFELLLYDIIHEGLWVTIDYRNEDVCTLMIGNVKAHVNHKPEYRSERHFWPFIILPEKIKGVNKKTYKFSIRPVILNEMFDEIRSGKIYDDVPVIYYPKDKKYGKQQ